MTDKLPLTPEDVAAARMLAGTNTEPDRGTPTMPHMDSDDDMLTHYSRALDEIYRLRAALAVESLTITGAVLTYSTLPKRAADELRRLTARMHDAARGSAVEAYEGMSSEHIKWALRQVGAPETLTRGQWEADRG